jgi:hypothetical protein
MEITAFPLSRLQLPAPSGFTARLPDFLVLMKQVSCCLRCLLRLLDCSLPRVISTRSSGLLQFSQSPQGLVPPACQHVVRRRYRCVMMRTPCGQFLAAGSRASKRLSSDLSLPAARSCRRKRRHRLAPPGVLVYTIGLFLAILLTATSFWVANTSYSGRPAWLWHLRSSPSPKWVFI